MTIDHLQSQLDMLDTEYVSLEIAFKRKGLPVEYSTR